MSKVYHDINSRPWAVAKLDELLGDPAVRSKVKIALSQGLRSDGGWCPGAVLVWARGRYRREEASALFLLLVTRFFDLEVAAGRARRAS